MNTKRLEAADRENDRLRYPYTHHGPAVFGSKLAAIPDVHFCIVGMNLNHGRDKLEDRMARKTLQEAIDAALRAIARQPPSMSRFSGKFRYE